MISRLLVSAALLTASPALAAGVPVVDSAALAQWVQQIEQLKQTYEAELRQIEEMQRQLEALTGPRAVGMLLNGAADIAAREAAESLDGIVTSAIEGSALPGAGADLSDRVAELREELDLGALGAFRGSEEGQDRALAVQAGAGMAAVATAEEGYRRANAAMERVGDMIAAIGTTTDAAPAVSVEPVTEAPLTGSIPDAGTYLAFEPRGVADHQAIVELLGEGIALSQIPDGTVIPQDLGLNWAISKKKDDYLGKRAQQRSHMQDPTRWKLVGLETTDGSTLPDGAYALGEGENENGQKVMQGRVTSTYHSPTLDRGIAMGLVLNGPDRMGEVLIFPGTDGKTYEAMIVDPVFYDPKGEKQNV